MINTYYVIGKSKGHIELTYNDQNLNVIKFAFKEPINGEIFLKIVPHIPYNEADLNTYSETTGLKVERQSAPNEKVALFCKFYMQFKNNQKYKATGIDGKRLKDYKITPEILTTYFKSTNFLFVGEAGSPGRHSVMNFCTYYNQIIAEMAEAGKSKYPDHWSLEFENKLNPQQLAEYWSHLRGLGLTAKKDERTGRVTDWVRKELLNEKGLK